MFLEMYPRRVRSALSIALSKIKSFSRLIAINCYIARERWNVGKLFSQVGSKYENVTLIKMNWLKCKMKFHENLDEDINRWRAIIIHCSKYDATQRTECVYDAGQYSEVRQSKHSFLGRVRALPFPRGPRHLSRKRVKERGRHRYVTRFVWVASRVNQSSTLKKVTRIRACSIRLCSRNERNSPKRKLCA